MASPLDFLNTRERFLPLHPKALLQRVLADRRLSNQERDQFEQLYRMVLARFHFDFHERIEQLKELYDAFDPDRDTLPLAELAPAQREARYRALADRIAELLLHGNYVELSREQLKACLEAQPRCRLAIQVRLSDYQDLRVFYRGVLVEAEQLRAWERLWQPQRRTVRTLKRVALVARASEKGGDVLRVKLFKDVVVEDLKIIHPRPILKMTWFDRVKVAASVCGALATTLWKLVTAVILSPVLFLVVLTGFIGAFLKGVYGFLTSRTKYMQTLSSSLYYQNLANNTSALARLVEDAEAEEAKELILAYFILYVERDRDFTIDELDRRVEAWLAEQFQLDVDFEVDDAVRKLREKGLVVERVVPSLDGADPTQTRRVLKVYDLPSALRRLDEEWDRMFLAANLGRASDDQIADGHAAARDAAGPGEAQAHQNV